jgi:hypothetical protein
MTPPKGYHTQGDDPPSPRSEFQYGERPPGGTAIYFCRGNGTRGRLRNPSQVSARASTSVISSALAVSGEQDSIPLQSGGDPSNTVITTRPVSGERVTRTCVNQTSCKARPYGACPP